MPPARVAFYVATVGAMALSVRALIVGPIPLGLALGVLAGYLALVLSGVFVLRLGMFADVIWRGDDDARGVALTFDDGPSPEHTPRVLDLLDRAGVKATFFVIGRKAEAYPELVREIVRRGHAVGVHGYTHDRLFSLRSPRVVRADLERAVRTLEPLLGRRPTLFRPPIGHSNAVIGSAARALDFVVVGWSVRALDGVRGARPERVARRVIPKLRDGAIVLLHDAAEKDDHRPAGVEALPAILEAMHRRDLPGVRVDVWIDDPREPTSA